jgi:nucleoside-diphosphate kinase
MSVRSVIEAFSLGVGSAIPAARQLIGATNPLEAAPGSIRGDLATQTGENLVHGSDGPQSAAREIGIFFPDLP